MPTSPNVSAVTMDYSRVEDGSAVGQTAASALRREAYFALGTEWRLSRALRSFRSRPS